MAMGIEPGKTNINKATMTARNRKRRQHSDRGAGGECCESCCWWGEGGEGGEGAGGAGGEGADIFRRERDLDLDRRVGIVGI